MDKKDKTEEIIGGLIEKRKKENDAFIKLLNAIEDKKNDSIKPSGKPKKRKK